MDTNPSAQKVDDGLEELEAMRTVAGALRNLEPVARDRVIRWTCEKFGLQQTGPRLQFDHQRPTEPAPSSGEGGATTDLAELYAACLPKTDAEKTLVVSFWLQDMQGMSGIDAQSVNKQLKDLGHGVGNITRAFDRLMENRPQLMIQLKKAGTTKQARKTYRVTTEGKNAVEQMKQFGTTAG